MTGRIVVFGDVINDIIVKPLTEVTVNSDTRAEISYQPGGSASNQASWLGALGVTVSFVGRVGARDTALHADFFDRYGVDHHLALDAEQPTGTIVILVNDCDTRTMFVDRGASLSLSSHDMPDSLLASSALLHFTGYSLFGGSLETETCKILDRAKAQWLPFSVDPSSASFIEEFGVDRFLERTRGARFCFPNYDEGVVLTGLDDPHDIVRALTEYYETVVLTMDSRGAIVCDQGHEPELIPIQRVSAVDPTGAGDAFCAGFLRAWLHGMGPARAAHAGAAVAAEAVQHYGARPPMELAGVAAL